MRLSTLKISTIFSWLFISSSVLSFITSLFILFFNFDKDDFLIVSLVIFAISIFLFSIGRGFQKQKKWSKITLTVVLSILIIVESLQLGSLFLNNSLQHFSFNTIHRILSFIFLIALSTMFLLLLFNKTIREEYGEQIIEDTTAYDNILDC